MKMKKTGNEVDLPFVVGGTLVDQAIDIMRTHQRSGLVTVRRGRRIVLTDQELVDHLREKGKLPISRVKPSLITASTTRPKTLPVGFKARNAKVSLLKADLLNRKANFLVVWSDTATAMVVTDQETRASRLKMAVKKCVCTADPTHVFTPRQLLVSGRCNKDGAKVNCS